MDIVGQLRAGVTTRSAEEMRALACSLAGVLPPDTVLALHGDLGVGKTTFVQGLARGLGVTEGVTSPTFTISSRSSDSRFSSAGLMMRGGSPFSRKVSLSSMRCS